jgi:hypothetical protein
MDALGLVAKWRAEADLGWDMCSLSPDQIELLRRCAAELEAAAGECERLRADVAFVVERFKRDEAQGFRSRDRRFAIEILDRGRQ